MVQETRLGLAAHYFSPLADTLRRQTCAQPETQDVEDDGKDGKDDRLKSKERFCADNIQTPLLRTRPALALLAAYLYSRSAYATTSYSTS